ncbi:MAG: MFS transporter [Spirochaetales bacterium]|nr:MFS transporter [Spirochaetales bacterium]
MGVSVFTNHLISALSLSRVQLSTAYMVGTLVSAFFMTRAGRIYDRRGARPAASTAVLGLALCLLLFTQVDRAASLLENLFQGGLSPLVCGFSLAVMGFLGIRFFGQGVLTLVSRTMVMRWFETRRGRVAAIMGIATSAGFSYTPRLLQTLIDAKGWRGAWATLAAVLLLVALPMVLLLFRDSPERCGMEMEQGLKPLKHQSKKNTAAPDATLAQARKDPRYWSFALMMAWWALFNTAFTFHVVDIFAFKGASATEAVSLFLPITFVAVASNFLGSWASDSMDLPPLYLLMTLGLICAGGAMFFAGAPWSRYLLIGGFGLSNGLRSVLTNIAWPRMYGRKHLGEIAGSAMSMLVAGSAIGPWVFSLLRTTEGSYVWAGLLGILGPFVLALPGIWVFFRPKKSS